MQSIRFITCGLLNLNSIKKKSYILENYIFSSTIKKSSKNPRDLKFNFVQLCPYFADHLRYFEHHLNSKLRN